jgi:hypothetical protein
MFRLLGAIVLGAVESEACPHWLPKRLAPLATHQFNGLSHGLVIGLNGEIEIRPS